MTENTPPLLNDPPHRLREQLNRVRQVMRHSARLVMWRIMLIGLAGFMSISALLDATFDLALPARLILNGVMLLIVLWICRRWIHNHWRATLDVQGIAGILERRYPQRYTGLSSALQLSSHTTMGQVALLQLDKRVPDIAEYDVIDRHAHLSRWIMLVVVVLLSIAPWRVWPNQMGIWAQRNLLFQDVPWPRDTVLTIAGARDNVLFAVKGESLTVDIRARGIIPPGVKVSIEHEQSAPEVRDLALHPEQHGVNLTLPAVQRECRLRVTGGDGDTGWVTVVVQPRPVLHELTATITPPTYTGLGTSTQTLKSGVVRLWPGSQMTLKAVASDHVVDAFLQWKGTKKSSPPTRIQGRVDATNGVHFEGLSVPASQSGDIFLVDSAGLSSQPTPLSFHVRKDTVPMVSLRSSAERRITAQARVPVVIHGRDDLGVKQVTLEGWRDAETPDYRELWKENYPQPDTIPHKLSGETVIAVQQMAEDVTAGDRLALRGVARDGAPGSSTSRTGRSAVLEFLVVSDSEMMDSLLSQSHRIQQTLEELKTAQDRLGASLQKAKKRELPALVRQQRRLEQQLKSLHQRMSEQRKQWDINFPEGEAVPPWSTKDESRLTTDIQQGMERVAKHTREEKKAEAQKESNQVASALEDMAESLARQLSAQSGITLLAQLIEYHDVLHNHAMTAYKQTGAKQTKVTQGPEHAIRWRQFNAQWVRTMAWLGSAQASLTQGEPTDGAMATQKVTPQALFALMEESEHPEIIHQSYVADTRTDWKQAMRSHRIIAHQLRQLRQALSAKPVDAKSWLVRELKAALTLQERLTVMPWGDLIRQREDQATVGHLVEDAVLRLLPKQVREDLRALTGGVDEGVHRVMAQLISSDSHSAQSRETVRFDQRWIADQLRDLIAATESPQQAETPKPETAEKKPTKSPEKEKKTAPPVSQLRYVLLRQERLKQSTATAKGEQWQKLKAEQTALRKLLHTQLTRGGNQ